MIEIEMTMKPDIAGNVLQRAASFFKPKETLSGRRFQQLLEPLKEHLSNFIFHGMNFSQDADDVFQETVLRAFKYRTGFDVRRIDSFKTWLFSIADNQIKAYYNAHGKQALDETCNLDTQSALEASDPKEKQLIRDIYEVAMSLNSNQRNVFFLFYDHHFSIKEIAGITGLKEGNIKFILNQCRETIKVKLSEHQSEGKIKEQTKGRFP